MKILLACSEVFPFSKTYELGDFAGSLPVALRKLGHDVRVITPKYKCTDDAHHHLKQVLEQVDVPISNRNEACSILEGRLDGEIPVYFVKKDPYFHRDELYGDSQGDYPDNAERFIYFSRSIPEVCKALDFSPDILHCNDWQTGLVPVYLRKTYQDDPFFANTATVFTVHNLSYQGLFWHYDMHLTGLGWDLFTPNGLEYYGKINLMKGGLIWADALSTVSKKYSQEIQTKEFGHGLEGVLQFRNDDLTGIMYGADYQTWNPETDTLITQTYSSKSLTGKVACKRELLKTLELPVKVEIPILAFLSDLHDQKGVDLVADITEKLMEEDLYLLVSGTGHERYHKHFQRLSEKYPKKTGIRLDSTTKLSHEILAGADMLLLPSRYEPAGASQIYGLKYGTVPIVRATGGLDDAVKTFQPKAGTGTGIKFSAYKSENLLTAIKKALNAYQDKKLWKALQLRGMQEDFSWDVAAKEHEKLYTKAYAKVQP